jgi:hypothetical protein
MLSGRAMALNRPVSKAPTGSGFFGYACHRTRHSAAVVPWLRWIRPPPGAGYWFEQSGSQYKSCNRAWQPACLTFAGDVRDQQLSLII